MKTSSWLLLSLAAAAGIASAQNAPLSGIAETTDPVKIAEIEQRAQEIAARPQTAQDETPVPAKRAKRHRAHKARPAMAQPRPAAAPS